MKLCTTPDLCIDFDSMQKSDTNNVLNFLKKTFPHMKKAHYFWINTIQKYQTNLLKDHDDVVGLLSTSTPNKNELWVNLIGVEPTLQGKKVGTRLLEIADTRARQAHVSEMHLDTELIKPQNIKFYQKNGWHIKRIDVHGYSHCPAIHMTKKIQKN